MLGRPMRARSRPLLFGLLVIALGTAMASSALAKPKWKPAPKKPATEAPAKAEEPATKAAEAPAPEPAVKGAQAPKEGAKDPKGGKVTTVEESSKDKGVKTYKFSAVEVEGRLKSPQIAYFLRRVRAEFEAGDLGHRSFVPELKDTRRSPSLR
jgi:hypothetical protein